LRTFQAIADNLQHQSGIYAHAILVKSVHIRPTSYRYARRSSEAWHTSRTLRSSVAGKKQREPMEWTRAKSDPR
jgi:hypothetical protein